MKRKIVVIIAVIVAIVSIGVLAYPFLSNYLLETQMQSAVSTYSTHAQEMDEAERERMWQEATEYNRTIGGAASALADPFGANGTDESDQRYMQLLNADNTGVMCFIDIPVINVYLPVYHGTSDAVLENGIGHLKGTSLPVGGASTHAVLSGHTGVSNARMFTDLVNLKQGHMFYVHTLGKILAYQVDQIETVLPNDTSKLAIESGKDYCTLVTCTPFGVNSHRLLVRGSRVPYIEDTYESQRVMGENAAAGSKWVEECIVAFSTSFGGVAAVAMLYYIFGVPIRDKRRKTKMQKQRQAQFAATQQQMRAQRSGGAPQYAQINQNAHMSQDTKRIPTVRQGAQVSSGGTGRQMPQSSRPVPTRPQNPNIQAATHRPNPNSQQYARPATQATSAAAASVMSEPVKQKPKKNKSKKEKPPKTEKPPKPPKPPKPELTPEQKERRRKLKGKILQWLGIFVLLAGVVVYFAPDMYSKYIDYNSNREIARIAELYGDDDDVNEQEVDGFDFGELDEDEDEEEDGSESKPKMSKAEKRKAKMYDKAVKYNKKLFESGQSDLKDPWSLAQPSVDLGLDDDLFGYIKIPAMDVKLPLYFGASNQKMAKGAVILGQTSLPIGGKHTNSVIAGHRGYRGAPFFREIEKLKKGDKVIVRNPWGRLTYKVAKIKIIDPNDSSKILIQEGKDLITLITCHPYRSHGKQRYVVYCKRVKKNTNESDTDPADDADGDESDIDEVQESSEGMIEQENTMRIVFAGAIILILFFTLIPSKKERARRKAVKQAKLDEKAARKAERAAKKAEKKAAKMAAKENAERKPDDENSESESSDQSDQVDQPDQGDDSSDADLNDESECSDGSKAVDESANPSDESTSD